MRVPRVAKDFASVFTQEGLQCHLVGGAVRDLVMGRPVTDLDIATDATPDRVAAIFRRVIPTGIRHGTVTVLYKGARFEVTTFRTESGYSDGRRPDAVTFSSSLLEDLSRRDFTMNALAWDLADGTLRDPYDGRADIAAGLIRAIGDAEQRFREDGLRPLRACRFAAQLGFRVEEATAAAIPRTLTVVAAVSAERVHDELVKILLSPAPSVGLELMRATGILSVILPELAEGVGVAQGDLHCHDVFTHCLKSCDAAPARSLELRLAALLHDVGKPRARGEGPGGRPTFHGHEAVSREIAALVLQRLRFPTAVVKRVTHLVAHHMFNYQEVWTDAAVRRLIARVGEDAMDDLVALRRADQLGMCEDNALRFPSGLARLVERVQEVRSRGHAFSLRDLAVDGSRVMARLGLPPGPAVGTILQHLLQAVLDDPALNEEQKLLEIAEKLYRERMQDPGG
jgi:tRNA nucleotidyltransferase/poly(A) polymerase